MFNSEFGYQFRKQALTFDPDSDPEQEKTAWTGRHHGENTFQIHLPKRTKWTL